VNIAVQIEPASGTPPAVEYRWDPDTEILIATLDERSPSDGLSGTVELQGNDGSWLNLDVTKGCIQSVEVAVWPELRRLAALQPPTEPDHVRVTVPARRSDNGAVASVEVTAPLAAESDQSIRTVHFRVGSPRSARTVRIGRDVLLDIDASGRLCGLWLLNVPPLPEEDL
jgi:hypothetical protein